MIYLHFFGLICVDYYLASIPLSFITLTFHDANLHVAPDNIVSVVIDRGLIGQWQRRRLRNAYITDKYAHLTCRWDILIMPFRHLGLFSWRWLRLHLPTVQFCQNCHMPSVIKMTEGTFVGPVLLLSCGFKVKRQFEFQRFRFRVWNIPMHMYSVYTFVWVLCFLSFTTNKKTKIKRGVFTVKYRVTALTGFCKGQWQFSNILYITFY